MLEKVNGLTLSEAIKDNKKVVVKFGAEWCSGCKAISPYLDKLQKDHPDVKFVEVDADVESDLVAEYNIRNLPTLISFTGTIKSGTLTGSGLNFKVLKDFVTKA